MEAIKFAALALVGAALLAGFGWGTGVAIDALIVWVKA